jgi:hypothetical protein
MSIDGTFVDAIGRIATKAALGERKPVSVKLGVTEYLFVPQSDGGWTAEFSRETEPVCAMAHVSTLDGFIAYVKDNRDGLDLSKTIVRVAGPEAVFLVSALEGELQTRREFLKAEASRSTSGYGSYTDIEAFIVWLMTSFEQTTDRDAVIRLLGNVTDENVKTVQDDGFTQTVTAKTGAALRKEVSVPNPVRLAPFRTFREVAQPASPFLLRLQKGREGSLPQATLFEADGQTWRLEAVKNIREYLAKGLPDGTTVIA